MNQIEVIRKRTEESHWIGATPIQIQQDVKYLLEALDTANAKVERYREALEYYANEDHWAQTIKTAKALAEVAQDALAEEKPKQDTDDYKGTEFEAIKGCNLPWWEHNKQPTQEGATEGYYVKCLKHDKRDCSECAQEGATIDREKLEKAAQSCYVDNEGKQHPDLTADVAKVIRSILT